MKLFEILNLYKTFELGIIVKGKDTPNKIKGYQLEKYFIVDDIKIEKNKGIQFYLLYKHTKSGEVIRLKGLYVKENEKFLYKQFSNNEMIEHVLKNKELPHQQRDVEFDYELMEE